MADFRTIVVLFKMRDCPACQEFAPRFRRVAAQNPDVKSYVVDVDEHPGHADHYEVTALPTTMVMRRPQGVFRVSGSIPDDQVQYLFALARYYA